MSLFLPFNYKPESTVQINGGSYTIPADKYAYVTANVSGGSIFRINGIDVLSSATRATNVFINGTGGFLVPDKHKFEGSVIVKTGGNLVAFRINGVNLGNIGSFTVGEGANMEIVGSNDTVFLIGVATRMGADAVGGYWVGPGDVLDDTVGNMRLNIALYQIP